MQALKNIIENLFPSHCLLCEKIVSGNIELCKHCIAQLVDNKNACSQCALPLQEQADKASKLICGRCISQPPFYDYAISRYIYQSDKDAVVRKLVHQLKYQQKIIFSQSMGLLLAISCENYLLQNNKKIDCIIPVPLHKKRMRQRGFNQSVELAHALQKKLKVPIIYEQVIRQKSTCSQSGLTAKQRKKNIKNAFKVVKPLSYQQGIIIDDVITTGATVNELAKELKKNGMQQVGIASFARAPI